MTLNHLLPNLPWLINLAARFTPNTAEAEDCAMVAIERIATRLDEFPTEPQARAFLAKTARNAAIDASRTAANREKAGEAWADLQDYSDEQVEMALRLRLVRKYGIPTLQAKQQVMALMFLEGVSFDEVAQAMCMSRKAVANQHGLIIRDLKRWAKKGNLI